jgi:hypothetical protein
MGQLAAIENRQGFLPASTSEHTTRQLPPAGPMARIYREIGLAIVASALEIQINDLDPEVGKAVRRGANYALVMLKSRPRADAA